MINKERNNISDTPTIKFNNIEHHWTRHDFIQNATGLVKRLTSTCWDWFKVVYAYPITNLQDPAYLIVLFAHNIFYSLAHMSVCATHDKIYINVLERESDIHREGGQLIWVKLEGAGAHVFTYTQCVFTHKVDVYARSLVEASAISRLVVHARTAYETQGQK